jgi:hypothetical protein
MMQDLNQQEYSDFMQRNLQGIFPLFRDFFRFEKDVYIIEYPSENKYITLWVSTQDCEITIGLDKDGECIWHTHMSQFGAYEPETELDAAVKFLTGIFDGSELIVTNSNNDVFVTNTIEESMPENEFIYKTWKEF